MTAVGELDREIRRARGKIGGRLYAVFIDFKQAFDRASREVILGRVRELGVGWKIERLLGAILQEDTVGIHDGVREIGEVRQTTGVAQGDCLSPLLFAILVGGIVGAIREEAGSVKVLMYADDLVIYGERVGAVQLAVRALQGFCEGKGLVVNQGKTKAMKFRGGGGQTGKRGQAVDAGRGGGICQQV